MKNKWKLLAIIAVIIIIVLMIALILTNTNKNSDNSKIQINEEAEEEPIRIMLSEELNKEGVVDGLENVTWNHANMNQYDGHMDVFVDLRNNSAKDKVASKKLTITLLNKNGKEIASKEATMEEMDINGASNLQATFEAVDYVVVYDILVSAK